MIYCYEKYVTREISRLMNLPSGAVELATVDRVTYVHIPDNTDLGDQPAEIAASVKQVALSAAEISAIKAASPHVRLINERVAEKIGERYSVSDEIKLLRTAPSPEFDRYNEFVEDCRKWGLAQKSLIGL